MAPTAPDRPMSVAADSEKEVSEALLASMMCSDEAEEEGWGTT